MKRFVLMLLCVLLTFGTIPAQQRGKKADTEQTSRRSTGKKKSRTAKKSGAKKSSKGGSKARKNRSSKKPMTSAELKKQRQKNARELREARQKIKLNTRETEKQLNQLNLVESEIGECESRIKRLTIRVDSLTRLMSSVSDSIAALDSHLTSITKTYARQLRKSQGRRQHTSDLAFIFSSNSFAQAYRRMQSLRQFDKWRRRKGAEIASVKERLDGRRKELSSLQGKTNRSLAQIQREQRVLQRKQTETSALVDRLQEQGAELQQLMEQKSREAAALDAELDRIIAEEARKERERQERIAAEQRRREEEARLKAEEEARERAEAEAARLAAEEAAAKEKAAREAKAKAEALAKAEAEAKDKAEKQRLEKEAKEAKKEQQRREKEAKDAKKAQERKERELAKARTERGKGVKHKGKDNGSEMASGSAAPSLHTPSSGGPSGVAKEGEMPQGSDFESLRGRLPFPVAGRYTIVKRFGRQKHPTLPHVETNNSGIDIETMSGAQAKAVCDGEVSAVFRPDGYNNVVVVRHGRFMTVYANLGSLAVSSGQKIKAGQAIGNVYADPNDNGRSVLHFEVRHGRQKENPELWLRR